MNSGAVADLLQHALLKLQPGIRYVIDHINGFNPSIGRALSLSPFLYSSLLQLSGILTKYGNNYIFNLWNIDTLIVSMKESISITTSRWKFERDGKNLSNALAWSVTEVWQNLPVNTISSMFGKVPKVLQKIIDDGGRNDLVEGRRWWDKIIISYYYYFYYY